MTVFGMERQPILEGIGKIAGLFAGKITRVSAGHFAECRDISRKDRYFVPRSLDQRQAKALNLRGGDQASASGVALFKIFIADGFQPEQAFAQLGMIA